MDQKEFDGFSASYEDLLRDPIRDRFAGKSDFFHRRKRDLIRDRLRTVGDTHKWSYLDLGCGKGELATLLREDFGEVVGTDPSSQMMESIRGFDTRVQEDPAIIPFEDGRFNFVTIVCVLHHVPPRERPTLMAEVRRVLKPGGEVCIIEHNPWNPATRLIVSRTPVDASAVLLSANESVRLLRHTGFIPERREFFLYLPERLYRRMAGFEKLLSRLPFGGQYAVFGQTPV